MRSKDKEIMAAKENGKKNGKFARFMIGLLIFLVVLAIIGGVRGWLLLSKEHREAASLPLDAIDFSKLHDGTYQGFYEGGMYQWRVNECEVKVTNGKVSGIRLLKSDDPGGENMDPTMLYERVIQNQTLQVDTISGASLTSKAYLQCVENALIKAQ